MGSKKSSIKGGAFKWNKSGWLGLQIGGTSWLLLLGILLLFHNDIIAGISIIMCFFLLNAIGTSLWLRRGKIAPYHAVQIFCALLGGLSVLTIMLVDWAGYFPPEATGSDYAKWLLIIPAVMVLFHFQERSSKKNIMK